MGTVLPLAISLSAFTSTVLSAYLIHCHLKYMAMPAQQRRIVALVLLVPIYSACSFFSIAFPATALFFDMIRDCYESYVIYSFLALLLCYIGETGKDDMNEEIVLFKLLEKRSYPCLWPLNLCYPPEILTTYIPHSMEEATHFLLTCKAGVLQFFLIKPITSLLAIVFHSVDQNLYSPENLAPVAYRQNSSYLYFAVIINVSMTFSLWYLVKFYYALRESLKRHNPVVKFASVKAILFFSYWQGVAIAFLRWFGVLDGLFGVPQQKLSTEIQNSLICAEMLIVSLVMQKAFSYKEYRFQCSEHFPEGNLHDVLKEGFKDAVKDINEISPVVLPSTFKPRVVSIAKISSVEMDTTAFTTTKL